MNEKEKYSAEIDARLVKFGRTINEIRTKKELRNESRPELNVDTTVSKHREAQAKLKKLEGLDSNAWEKTRAEVDDLMSDIEKELREALVYFA